MDVKTIIILLITLCLIVLIYKDVVYMKKKIDSYEEDIKDALDTNINQFKNDINNNIIKCIHKVKDISTENIKQLRKIIVLNNQPIKKIKNHFTETDDSEFGDMSGNDDYNKQLT